MENFLIQIESDSESLLSGLKDLYLFYLNGIISLSLNEDFLFIVSVISECVVKEEETILILFVKARIFHHLTYIFITQVNVSIKVCVYSLDFNHSLF